MELQKLIIKSVLRCFGRIKEFVKSVRVVVQEEALAVMASKACE